ncbi:MAG TPA: hypothetical protein DCY93_01800 [Firmicutes bacterium]|nr:hypothetical protein [Bacillota bacterium]
MLELKNIKKSYVLDKNNNVPVLHDLSLTFEDSGFAAILGPSGCGKTTMLNIIGGLDRYDSGDLIVDDKSTKDYKDVDWDTYRNRKIGIVFQNYNLIPHLTVLSNVELALTLSGSSVKFRKKKAKEALTKVGLGDMINKRPNQLSGGQMQRVAIARAIVNDPKIILADEPTGALDSKTSVQVMDILKELSKNRLVIIVTHNEELANKYATRIIRMKDGVIIGDENVPQNELVQENKNLDSTIDMDANDLTMVDTSFSDQVNDELHKQKRMKKKSSMSFQTALNISAHNIMTKKGRTILTSIASSFGIIGVALVLSLSNGFSNYVHRAERESLSQFPISIERNAVTEDFLEGNKIELEEFPDSNSIIIQKPAQTTMHINDINEEYIQYIQGIDKSLVSSVKYNYSIEMNAVTLDASNTPVTISTSSNSVLSSITGSSGYWSELTGDENFIRSQYDIIGQYPQNSNELLISVDRYNRISYYTMKALGYDVNMAAGESQKTFTFDDIINKKFKIFSSDDLYVKQDGSDNYTGRFLKSDANFSRMNILMNNLAKHAVSSPETIFQSSDFKELMGMFEENESTRNLTYYTKKSGDSLRALYEDDTKGETLKIVGILRPKDTTAVDLMSYGIYYPQSLTQKVLNMNKDSELTKEIKNHCYLHVDSSSLANTSIKCISSLNTLKEIDMSDYYNQRLATATDTNITSITIYPKSFKEKSKILTYLDNYNDQNPDGKIIYTDLSSVLISSIGTMINIISIVLICFAAIALVTSSVMMAIIMYTSVIERTKEIGVLRSIGARKKDVSRLFQAETVIIGFISGLIGIIMTYILCLPVNAIINSIYPEANIGTIAFLNPLHAVILILVSVLLTLTSGFIPARIASKKDPVICLRTE